MCVGNEESGGGRPAKAIVDREVYDDSVGGVECNKDSALDISGLKLVDDSDG